MLKTTFTGITAAAVIAGSLMMTSAASAYERWVNIVNYGDSEIVHVRIRHIDTRHWGPDLLGNYVIEVGDDFTVDPVRPNGYCRFDIKLEYADGNTQVIRDQNLCVAEEIVADGWDFAVA
jgi:hypothetical protein